ncbi:MAG: hypothetical protein GEU82_14175 [Luteitalea sp.]|nr:hypothetical protein [Luteitalea sp.]
MAWNTSDLLAGDTRPCASYAARRIDTPRGDVRVRAIEVKHWGARLRRDTHRGYNGYILEREGGALLFGGDNCLDESPDVAPSTDAFSFGQLSKPCARAITRCASCSANALGSAP